MTSTVVPSLLPGIRTSKRCRTKRGPRPASISRRHRVGLLLLRRLAWLVPVLLLVSTITFSLMHLAPGGPWDPDLREGAGSAVLSETAIEHLNRHYGLDESLPTQFGRYVLNAAQFDFGESYHFRGQQVRSIIGKRWPRTLLFGGICLVIIVPAGIALGALAAFRRNSLVDHMITGCSALAASVPSFVVGLFLVMVFSVQFNRVTGGRFYLPATGFGLDQHLVLPVLALSLLPVAFLARLTRSSALQLMAQDHVRTARAKGLAERAVAVRHVLRNSLVPVISTLGPLFAHLVTGTVVIETLFGMRGLGATFVDAVAVRDYPMIMAFSLLYALVIAVANLAVDIAYVVIDPQVDPS